MTIRGTRRSILIVTVLALGGAPRAAAGPYGDALGKCLVSGTTPTEKTTLVRWMFAIMALHPDVQSSTAITPEKRTEVSKEMGQLVERLLTERCANEVKEAVRYEGEATLTQSFALLGQVATRELFANPEVAKGLGEFSKYVDEKKVKGLFAPTAR